MGSYYFHYTSRTAAQLIAAARVIRPDRSGVIYLADDLYGSGAEAADALGIPPVGPPVGTLLGQIPLTKPIEVVCCIPNARLQLPIGRPRWADPFRDEVTGAVLYRGGGRAFRYPGTIDVTGLPWLALMAP